MHGHGSQRRHCAPLPRVLISVTASGRKNCNRPESQNAIDCLPANSVRTEFVVGTSYRQEGDDPRRPSHRERSMAVTRVHEEYVDPMMTSEFTAGCQP